MSADQLHSLLLGKPLCTHSNCRNGFYPGSKFEKKQTIKGNFTLLLPNKCLRRNATTRASSYGARWVHFLPLGVGSRYSFKMKCANSKEPFYQSFTLVRSFLPVWQEGLFLVRCSVFAMVMPAIGFLLWYSKLKVTNYIEAHVLPSVCSILGDYLQREISVGKVRSVSPFGITLSSCSIGPHGEEFSCGEVPTMKLRFRPFSSLRRGKIVISAFLSQPTLLVSQRKDFSWLGIPPPLEGGAARRHSSEEGIDHRTKIRRLSREDYAARWALEMTEDARKAAEIGYVAPREWPKASASAHVEDASYQPFVSFRSDVYVGMDEHLHLSGSHFSNSQIKNGPTHEAFGMQAQRSRFKSWYHIFPRYIRRRFKKGTLKNVLSEPRYSSRQRILKRSAAAALAYFHSLESGRNGKPNSAADATTLNVDETVDLNKINEGIIDQCGKVSINAKAQITQTSKAAFGNFEGNAKSSLPGNIDTPESYSGIGESKTGEACKKHHSDFVWPSNRMSGFLIWKRTLKDFLSDSFVIQVQKWNTCFGVKVEELAAELSEGLNVFNSEGIHKIIPVTLDSVNFSGGCLMLLGYGDCEPREMINANGLVQFQNNYSKISVQLTGDCMQWRTDTLTEDGGKLSTDVFVDTIEQKWHANLKIANLFAPLFERIIEIPAALSNGRASGEVHLCMSRGDTFPNLHGQIDVNGLDLHLQDAPSSFSELRACLCFRGQRVFLHNASGWFGDAPVEASGDFGINPEDGEFHLMCQVPCVEVNALMKTLRMRPLLFPVAGSVTAVFNCQGPLDAPVFVGSGMTSRKFTNAVVSTSPPSVASESLAKNREDGAVAAFDRVPISHLSANFTFNIDNCVADLYGIRARLLDGGEIRGAGNAWICPEGEMDNSALDINFSGNFSFDEVLLRYLARNSLDTLKIGEVNGETKLSGSILRPSFDIKWSAPNAEDSFSDARGHIIIAHEFFSVLVSSTAFELSTKVETSYPDDYWQQKGNIDIWKTMPLFMEGVDLDLRMCGFEFADLVGSNYFDSPRPFHLKAAGRIKFLGRVEKSSRITQANEFSENGTIIPADDGLEARLHGDIHISGLKINQLMLAPQLTGLLSISPDAMKLDAVGRPDESLFVELSGPFWSKSENGYKNKKLITLSLQRGQLRVIVDYQYNQSSNVEIRNLPLDELEISSLRGSIQKAEVQLNFQKRRGRVLLSVLHPKFSGVLGEALDVAARWSGDVITVEKVTLEQTSSRYELQGEYVLPGMRDRYYAGKQLDGFFQEAMAGNLGRVVSSVGRWRLRLEVPGAEVAEMLPLARLISRSTDPAVRSRSKDLFMQTLQMVGFYAKSMEELLQEIKSHYNLSDDVILEDLALPGLAEFKGRWRASFDSSGGGNGDTMADFDFHGEDWEWGTYKTHRVQAAGSYSNNHGLRLEKFFIQKDNATLHADGTFLGPITNLHFAVLNFPVPLVPTLIQVIETSNIDSLHSLRKLLTPIRGILHMEGDLRGTLAKPECDVQIRLLDGAIGGVDLSRAEIVASVTSARRFLFNANFEPVVHSGHVHIQGSIPGAYVLSDSTEEIDKSGLRGGDRHFPVRVNENVVGSLVESSEKKAVKDKTEEGWELQLAESLKNFNLNVSDEEVRIDANVKDGGMMLITALCPYANWLHGYADIVLQVRGTVENPILDGSASLHRASISSPVLRKPLTNLGATIHVKSNRLCIGSVESRVSRRGRLFIKGNLPLKTTEPSFNDQIDVKCEVLEVRAKNIMSGQVDSQLQITGSLLQPNISGRVKLSHGEVYLPQDKGNSAVVNRLAIRSPTVLSTSISQMGSSGNAARFFGLYSSSERSSSQSTGQESEIGNEIMKSNSMPGIDVKLTDLKVLFGPELRMVYPLILNFSVSGELELNGLAHSNSIKPRGVLTFENGDVNLVATQVRLKRDHLNIAKFEPEQGLDPNLDLTLVGSEWQLRIQNRASTWQDNLVVTSQRGVDQDVLSPNEAARAFENQLAVSLLEGNGQLAFKKLATSTLETLMPRIEGKGEFGQARWRLVYAPQIPSLLSVDPTVDPLKSLASSISFGTEVEVQLGKQIQASIVRQMKDSEMAMQWTLIYQLTSRLRVVFQSAPSNRLLFEYSASSQD